MLPDWSVRLLLSLAVVTVTFALQLLLKLASRPNATGTALVTWNDADIWKDLVLSAFIALSIFLLTGALTGPARQPAAPPQAASSSSAGAARSGPSGIPTAVGAAPDTIGRLPDDLGGRLPDDLGGRAPEDLGGTAPTSLGGRTEPPASADPTPDTSTSPTAADNGRSVTLGGLASLLTVSIVGLAVIPIYVRWHGTDATGNMTKQGMLVSNIVAALLLVTSIIAGVNLFQ